MADDDCDPDCKCPPGPCERYSACEGCPGDCSPACMNNND